MFTLFAILVGTAINFGAGFLWYKNFGKVWAASHGFKTEDLIPSTEKMISAIVVSFLVTCGLTYLITMTDATTTFEGARIGFFTCLLIVAPVAYSGVIWANKPFKAYLVDIGSEFVQFIAVGGVLGALL